MFDKLFDKNAIKELLLAHPNMTCNGLDEVLTEYIINILNSNSLPKIETKYETSFIYAWNNYRNPDMADWRRKQVVCLIARNLQDEVLNRGWPIWTEQCEISGTRLAYKFTEQGVNLICIKKSSFNAVKNKGMYAIN